MRKFLNFIFIYSILVSASAQTAVGELTEEQLARKVLYVEISLNKNHDILEQLETLEKTASFDKFNMQEETIRAYVAIDKYDSFLKAGFEFRTLTAPSLLLPRSELDKTASKGRNDWNYYPSYPQYIEMMYQFEEDYPDLCEVVNIGQSVEGRDILFVHINNNLGVETDEPEFMYTSSMHGDELTGYVLMLRLIDYLLENYDNDPRIENMVNEIDIWINPLANPDGAFFTGNSSVYGAIRENANLIDLNRNYPDPEDGLHPDDEEYQMETEVFMDFADSHNFVMAANLHTGAEVVNYPWDTWVQRAADDDWWIFVSKEYADTAHQYSPSSYFTNPYSSGFTNGFDWYSISGGRQDYMNYFKYCREMTLELSNTKMPAGNQLPHYWDYNYRSLLNYMEQVLYGVRGVIKDAVTNNPIKAKVFINSHDIDESYVYSDFPEGNYNRLLKQGLYSFTFSALGHFDKTISMVNASDYKDAILNVQMEPWVGYTEDQDYNFLISPNPATDFINIKLPTSNSYEISLIDSNGKLLKRITAKGDTKISLMEYPSGSYIIVVSSREKELSRTLILKTL